MKIKHKETGKERNLSLYKWRTEYLKKGLSISWEILNLENIVTVQTIKENGETSITLMDLEQANRHKKQFNESVVINHERISKEFYLDFEKKSMNKSNTPQKKRTKPKPKRQFPIKEKAFKFWKLISENKLISSIIILIITAVLKYIKIL
jgi:hypothetical protein